MRRAVLVVALLMPWFPAITEPDRCNCAPERPLGEWCEEHESVWIAGVRVTSWELFEALDAHGHEIAVGHLSCESCKSAHANDGFCDEHRIGFIDGLAYLSALTYSLARGEVRDPRSITCSVCLENTETHGWCPAHEVGMVGNVELRNEADYRRAAESYLRLLAAMDLAERCEICAAMLVLDGNCHIHDITYEDGKPVAPKTRRADP